MSKTDIREERLLVELKKKGQMELKDITELFSISDSTARRMCVEVERKGKAIRTFGGLRHLPENASAFHVAYSYTDQETTHVNHKMRIGAYASELIAEGDILFLSGGTTVQQMTIALANRLERGELRGIMVLTNSIVCAELLTQHCEVMLTGGKMRLERRDVAGFLSEQMVRNSRFDKCFLGVDGIDLHDGLMAFDLDTANLDRLVARQSDTAYILADSSKFHQRCFTAYERFLPKHSIITDTELDEVTRHTAEQNHIRLTLV